MDILVQASQLLLSLSLLVILHEFGHYIPAKLFKTRVEKFYLFFNPWFSLFKKKIGETEWGIGWLPLGGFVKISGMVDESMDKEQMKQPAQPWEFRSKPAWQRLIIMLGGVTVNLIVGIVIYICVVYAYGIETIKPKDLTAGMAVHPYLAKYDIRSGDLVVSVDGNDIETINEINPIILLRGGRKLEVVHADGKKENIVLPEKVDYELFESGAFRAFGMRETDVKVGSLDSSSFAAKKLKLQKGDKFLAVNGNPIYYFDELQNELYVNRGKETEFTMLRGKDTVRSSAKLDQTGTLGFIRDTKTLDEEKIRRTYLGFGASIGKGLEIGMNTLGDYIGQLKFIFTKKGASSLGGFGSMGKLFPTTWDWQVFWLNTAFISIVLAFMNILPIPALDGGHVVFLLYEIITGKEAPQKVLEYAQYVGFFLLLGLLLYANGNDIYGAIFK